MSAPTNTSPFLRLFVEGFAAAIDAADVGVKWRQSGPYEADEVGIGLMTFPTGLNRAVALTPYPLGDDAALSDSEIGLQVKTRSAASDPRDVWDLDDAIANVLLGLYPTTLPSGIQIVTLQRTSSGSLGQDENERWAWSSNYPCTIHRPSAHRV